MSAGTVTISGADSVSLAAAANSSANRTYAVSNGAPIAAATVTSDNSSWLTPTVSGNKVTFTATANSGAADRSATVRVSVSESVYIDVTVTQAH